MGHRQSETARRDDFDGTVLSASDNRYLCVSFVLSDVDGFILCFSIICIQRSPEMYQYTENPLPVIFSSMHEHIIHVHDDDDIYPYIQKP